MSTCAGPRCPGVEATAHVCARCEVTTFCSKSCQRDDWQSHKPVCAAVNTAPGGTVVAYACPCCSNGEAALHAPGSLHAAAAAGDETAVARLSAGASRSALEKVDKRGHTALAVAAAHGQLAAARVLIAAGARVGSVLGDGALIRAVIHAEGGAADAAARAVAVVEELLRAGARDPRGMALRFACQYRALTVIEALLAGGVSVNVASEDGLTALHAAAEHGPAANVGALLARGATAGAADDRGWTPLHYAVTATVEAGDVDVIRALLDGGAPVDARSQTGSTPLWLAAQNGHAAAVALLCERGASVRLVKRSLQGRVTCLEIARTNGYEAVASILTQHGAKR